MIIETHHNQWSLRLRPPEQYSLWDFTQVGSNAPYISGSGALFIQSMKCWFINSAAIWYTPTAMINWDIYHPSLNVSTSATWTWTTLKTNG